MKKIIKDKTICFYNNKDQEIMYIDYSTDECIWYFYSDNVINVTYDMEIYNFLEAFMNQSYEFNDETLKNFKDDNKLIWFSDCYYNPDNKLSIQSVSCLNIERNDFGFKIWCTKESDKIINRPHKTHCISFSPSGNGRYSKNINNGSTLQDDFVILVYQSLISKSRTLKLK